MPSPSPDQEKVFLRVKLDNLAAAIKKMVSAFRYVQSEMAAPLIEPQILNRFSGVANGLCILKSLEESEGEIFASFLKIMTNVIHSIGNLTQFDKVIYDEQRVMLRALKNFEDQIKEFLPVIMTIDEERKKAGFETFGSLLQKLTDALQEKRFAIMRAGK